MRVSHINFVLVFTILFYLGISTSVQASLGKRPDFSAQLEKKAVQTGVDDVYQRLELSDKQKSDLDQNRKKYYTQMKRFSSEIVNLKRELRIELQKETINEIEILRVKTILDRRRVELSDLRLKGAAQIREILTPQQYDLFHKITQ